MRTVLLAFSLVLFGCGATMPSGAGGGSPASGGGAPGGGAGGGGTSSGGGGGTSTCTAPLLACGGACVDGQTDAANCGGCGTACGAGASCRAGACTALPADCRQQACPSTHYCDLANGQCKPGCASDGQCPQPGTCDLGTRQCVCAAGTHRCGTTCVPDTSVAGCGAACSTCTAPAHGTPVCMAGGCSFVCAAGWHRCGDACVSDTATATCGTRCSACSNDPNGAATCDGTACGLACKTDFRACGGACRTCPVAGTVGTACAADTCVATSCSATHRLCGGTCALCPAGVEVTSTSCDGQKCVAATCAATHRLCAQACALCPTTNVTATTCTGASCVASACAPGFKPCATGCCPKWSSVPLPATSTSFGGLPQLEFLPNGDGVVAYRLANGTLALSRWNVGGFTPLSTPPGVGSEPVQLAVFGTTIHLATLSTVTATSKRLVVHTLGATGWQSSEVTTRDIASHAIALDANGQPAVAVGIDERVNSTGGPYHLEFFTPSTTGTWQGEVVTGADQIPFSPPIDLLFRGTAAHLRTERGHFHREGGTWAKVGNNLGLDFAFAADSARVVTTSRGLPSRVISATVWTPTAVQSAVVETLATTNTSSSRGRMAVGTRNGAVFVVYRGEDTVRFASSTAPTGPFVNETVSPTADLSLFDLAIGPAGDVAFVCYGTGGQRLYYER